MRTIVQHDPDREMLAEIARLEPLAQWEQRARDPENPWKGKTKELEAARARLKGARAEREGEAQAEEVRLYQDLLERRECASSKVAALDAKLAALGDTTRDYFQKANARALWIGRPSGMANFPVHGGQPRDWRGHVIDASPLSASTGLKIVPDEEWDAVKQYRELLLQRLSPANELDTIDRDLRYYVDKNPALAFVKARQKLGAQ